MPITFGCDLRLAAANATQKCLVAEFGVGCCDVDEADVTESEQVEALV